MPIIDGTTGSNTGGFLIDDVLHPRGVYPYVDADHNFYFKFKDGTIYLKQGKVEDWKLANRDGGAQPITYTYTLIEGITLDTSIQRRGGYIQPGQTSRWTFLDDTRFSDPEFIPIGSRMAIGPDPNEFGRAVVEWEFVTTTKLPLKEGSVWVVEVDRDITVEQYNTLNTDKKLYLWQHENRVNDIGKHLNNIARLTFSA